MARLNSTQWEQARAEYEVRGVSLSDVARRVGVSDVAVGKRARKEGWVQGKSLALVDKKVCAIKDLYDVEQQSSNLPQTTRTTIDDVVRERLEADHMLAQFDKALSIKGLSILQSVSSPDAWETMTRGRRNLAPTKEAATTVNVNQQAMAGAVALPPPTPQPQDALRAALRGDFTGDSD